jgi:hypothetical protein
MTGKAKLINCLKNMAEYQLVEWMVENNLCPSDSGCLFIIVIEKKDILDAI